VSVRSQYHLRKRVDQGKRGPGEAEVYTAEVAFGEDQQDPASVELLRSGERKVIGEGSAAFNKAGALNPPARVGRLTCHKKI
jgi:hypothetical protein